jgi:pantoate--beta-alanine ligase
MTVRRSLQENDLTIVSIFVNPAQFAPHEDLSTYPRTLPRDLELLASQSFPVSRSSVLRSPSAVFLPSVQEMYPSGIVQDIGGQKGTFVEVKGYGHQMEGMSRPTFFRGVATVVTKLFNVIQVRPSYRFMRYSKLTQRQPTNTYFGQKDIQQALLLRRLCSDLLLSHPTAANLHIVPTTRDPIDGLALSSRNEYLSSEERRVAPALQAALKECEKAWMKGHPKEVCIQKAKDAVNEKTVAFMDVETKLDYIEMNDPGTFDIIDDRMVKGENPVILSGAMWAGKTRLIDNIILGDTSTILV